MEPNSIRTWDAMVEKFLAKYYPPSEALKRQSAILAFEMTPEESIRGAWERFKSLLKRCPNHGLSSTHQILLFYKGCFPEAKSELNWSAGGALLKIGEVAAMEVIERATSNDEGWNNERSKVHKVVSASESNQIDSISKQMELIHKKLDLMCPNSYPNQGGGSYNLCGNKAHPDVSFGNPNNTLQSPPGFTVSQGMIEPQKKSSEEILNAFMTQSQKNMEHTNKRLEKVEMDVHNIEAHLKNLDSQMSQIAQPLSGQHKPGQFPGQPTVNRKDCKAIHLSSEKSYEGPSKPETPPKPVAEPKTSPVEEAEGALQQMLGYVKFLKEAVSKKKKWEQYETINLTKNCSAILQRKLPAKMKDPGSFTIECTIGDCFVGNAICDLGPSINLMPLSLYKKMKIGPLKPTTITLQMADRSVSYPIGIVEDISVRVNEFFFPADFVILDMEEDGKVPLILGRSFLATVKALIDVDTGELTFRFNGQSVTFSIYESLKRHDGEPGGSLQHCNVVTTVDECVRRNLLAVCLNLQSGYSDRRGR
ncbi:uncharacterized protein LOC121778936 [Salvia splendens]|uniref:uncharacterized protein LOC121778936 n=1 Tax=Salvia splendens TaxID=180675 RepID=UPI001C275E8D|nr:uncharacterized protein LOC121778936 [Salvia splendens]